MATYHLSIKVGAKGKATAHAAYIARDGNYANLRQGEVLEHTQVGNLPAWSANNSSLFWQMADQHERANGSAYR